MAFAKDCLCFSIRVFGLMVIWLGLPLEDFGQSVVDLASLRQAETDGKKAILAEELAWNYRFSNPDSSQMYARISIAFAVRAHDVQTLAYALADLAEYYQSVEVMDSAMLALGWSLEARQLRGDPDDIGSGFNRLGIFKAGMGAYADAIVYFEQGIQVAGLGQKPIVLMSLWGGLGNANKEMGYLQEAAFALEQALKIAQESKVPNLIAKSLLNLAVFYHENSRPELAKGHYKEALLLWELPNDAGEWAKTVEGIGMLYYGQNLLDSALFYLKGNQKLLQEFGSSELLADHYNNLALVYHAQGNLELAERSYRLALSDELRGISPKKYAITLTNLAQLLFDRRKYTDVLEMVAALDSLDHADQGLQMTAFEIRSQTYRGLGDFESALLWKLRAAELSDSIGKRLAAVQNMTDRYLQERQGRERADRQTQIAQANLLQAQAENASRFYLSILLVAIVVVVVLVGLYFFQRQRLRIRVLTAEATAMQRNQDIQRFLQDAQQRALSVSVETQERERKRIARELHDRVGSRLSLIQIMLQSSLKNLSASPDKARDKLTQSVREMDEACDEVRAISKNLKAGDLARYGLQHALERFCDLVQEFSQLELHFAVVTPAEQLPQRIEMEVYDMVRTLIENILRHAQAKQFWLQIQEINGFLHIRVRDDGQGFDEMTPRSSKVGGSGLKNVKERVEALQGSYSIVSSKVHGTQVDLEIPINPQ
jgi:two-component system, NarL family, sensor kinase